MSANADANAISDFTHGTCECHLSAIAVTVTGEGSSAAGHSSGETVPSSAENMRGGGRRWDGVQRQSPAKIASSEDACPQLTASTATFWSTWLALAATAIALRERRDGKGQERRPLTFDRLINNHRHFPVDIGPLGKSHAVRHCLMFRQRKRDRNSSHRRTHTHTYTHTEQRC